MQNDELTPARRSRKATHQTTDARATAQRAKLDAHTETTSRSASAKKPKRPQSPRRASMAIEHAIGDYLLNHEGGNRSRKTIKWHSTALRFLREFLAQERQITHVEDIDAPDLTAWFVHLRKTPGARGKLRSERTVQTYARFARAFFHWLVRSRFIEDNPFERVSFPRVGKPLH